MHLKTEPAFVQDLRKAALTGLRRPDGDRCHSGRGCGARRAALRQAVETLFLRDSETRQHQLAWEVLVIDLDLPSCRPARERRAPSTGTWPLAAADRAHAGAGRAARNGETVPEVVLPGRTVKTLAVPQQAVQATVLLLGA